MLPGQFGGANWGASAADPATGMLYVRTRHHPTIHRLTEFDPARERGNAADAQSGPRRLRQAVLVLPRRAGGRRDPDDGPHGRRFRSPPSVASGCARACARGRARCRRSTDDVISEPGAAGRPRASGRRGPGSAAVRREPETWSRPMRRSRCRRVTKGSRSIKGKRYTGPLGRAFRAENGLSALSPPWAEIVAYDLNQGTLKWRVPLGTSPALAARGITNTGNGRRAWRNGPAVTAGGLIFIGSWADRTRARLRHGDRRLTLGPSSSKPIRKDSWPSTVPEAASTSCSAPRGRPTRTCPSSRPSNSGRGWPRRRATTPSRCRVDRARTARRTEKK